MKVWQHMRRLWPRWTLLPPLPFLVISLVDGARGELRWEHIALLLLIPGLAYSTAKTKKLCVGLYPMGLVALLYDAMRFVKNVGVDASTVHLCDLRATELRWFGVTQNGVQMTVHDVFQQGVHPALDVICAIPYGTFLFYCIGFAAYLYFRDFSAMQRFTWGWLLLNVAGFTTYHLYAAAPPWYFHTHGCAVDVLAHASEGPNLARVDAMFGMHYFNAMYGRASDVFGAMPSLHVAYPLIVVLEGWSLFRAPGRIFSVAFMMLMCFSAVYLDHHWVTDVVVGLAYAVVSFTLMRFISNVRRHERAMLPAEGSVRS